jgi:tetratricopeptide (TPR) repeat protein
VFAGAKVLALLGHRAAAADMFRRLIAADPLNGLAQMELGECLRHQAEQTPGEWDQTLVAEALRAYESARTRYPNNLRLVNNIAWLQLVAQGLSRQAFETAAPLRAVAANDLPAEMLETLGATHLGIGEWEPARQALEKALQRGGPQATTFAFLAQAYHHLGRGTEALQCLRQAQSLPKANPHDHVIVEQARRLMSRDG